MAYFSRIYEYMYIVSHGGRSFGRIEGIMEGFDDKHGRQGLDFRIRCSRDVDKSSFGDEDSAADSR